MDIYGILVIAAAVVLFIIINIIMWSIIIKIERKEKQEAAFNALYGPGNDNSTSQPLEEIEDNKPSIFFDYTETDIGIQHKEKRSGFNVKDDIVLIYTSETIK